MIVKSELPDLEAPPQHLCNSNKPNSKKMILGRERERVVISLRKQGKSTTEIAEELGVSARTAHTVLNRALARLERLDKVDLEQYRRMELDRLDAMQLSLWPKLTEENAPFIERCAAVKTILDVMKRRAELLGLDSPTRVDVKMSHEEWLKRLK